LFTPVVLFRLWSIIFLAITFCAISFRSIPFISVLPVPLSVVVAILVIGCSLGIVGYLLQFVEMGICTDTCSVRSIVEEIVCLLLLRLN
jgi:hypothetical protein